MRIRHGVDPIYAAATLDQLQLGSEAPRLYKGATPESPVNGMFSFFPCRRFSDAPDGFPRPEILDEIVTPTMTQGKRLNRQSELGRVSDLWERVVSQVTVELDLEALGAAARVLGVPAPYQQAS